MTFIRNLSDRQMLLAVLNSICLFVYLVDRARVRRQLSAVSQAVIDLGALATATTERLDAVSRRTDAVSRRIDAQGLRMSENERLAEFNVRRVNIALDRIETKVGRVR